MSTKSNFSLLVMMCGFAIVTQSGCSTKYVASSEKSLAYLQVFNMSGEPDKTAFISTYQEADGCKKRLWLQQGAYIPGDITTSFEKIEATRATAISIHGRMGNTSCVSTFSFIPETGRYYRAVKNGCNTVLLESSELNNFSVKKNEEVVLMDFKKAFSESGSWCSPSYLNQFKKDLNKAQ